MQMQRTRTHRAAFQLSGVSVRTTNADETGPDGRIPGLWGQYFQANLVEKEGVVHPHLTYGLYTDYESDATGPYTLLIGHEVEHANEGNRNGRTDAVAVPESDYLVFTTAKGRMEEVVPAAWGEIWKYFEHAPEQRSYTGDFELYDASSGDPEGPEVQIYIAIK